jgi:DUF4097 and DUF4098 domain-containing protein YvlB
MVSKIVTIFCICCVGLMLVFGAGCVSPPLSGAASREFQGMYSVNRTTALEVYNLNGVVEVTSGDGDRARVNATLSTLYGSSELDRVQILVTTDGVLRVETIHPVLPARVSVNYQITIPHEVQISVIDSSNGGITVRGVMGTASLTTSNGPINAETFTGGITAHTSNGAIVLRDVEGTVSASTSNAEIILQNVSAIVLAETSNGRISADVLSADQDVIVSTSNARVVIQLVPDLDADLSLSTSNGEILRGNVPVTVQQSTRTTLQGTIGSGGHTISVVTSNADIELRMLSV